MDNRRNHLHSTVNLGKVAIWNHLGWLVADTNLEASRAPVDELDSPLGLQAGNSLVHVVWNDITAVQQASSHVLTVARIALDHLLVWLKAGHSNFIDRVGLVGRLGSGHDRGIRNEREVNTRIGDEVSLKLVEIDVQRAVEAERGSNRGHNY